MQHNAHSYLTKYRSEVSALDDLVERYLRDGQVHELIRLNSYLRRYVSPVVVGNLFRRRRLAALLVQREIDSLAALILDIRGFVRTTDSVEHSDDGLDIVARLLRKFFARIIHIAFENLGLVGELAGDRILITFGLPPEAAPSAPDQMVATELALNAQRAVHTALGIQYLCEVLRADKSFPAGIRQFEVGMGICAGRRAWIGDIGCGQGSEEEDSWRHELTVISSAVNIAARAEEMTKDLDVIAAAPQRKIIVDGIVAAHLPPCDLRDLGEVKIRGMEDTVRLFHLIDLDPGLLAPPQLLTDEDRALAGWICAYLDGAIERDVAVRVQRSLSYVGQAVATVEIPDERVVCGQIVDRVVETFAAAKATLYRVDMAAETLSVVVSVGPAPLPTGTQLPIGNGIAGSVARSGEAVVIADVHSDEAWCGSQHDPDIHAMMCAPLRAGSQTIGVIQIMDDKVGTFTETNLSALTAFAVLATVALQNSRIYERTARVAQARSILTAAFMASLTLDDVLNAVMRAVQQTLPTHNATLYLRDLEAGHLVFAKVISASDNPPLPGSTIPLDTGIVGWVVQHKAPRLILDTTSDPDWHGAIGSDVRSMVCVPLVSRGQALGAIQVLSQAPHSFADDDLETLTWLAASAAIAVDSAAQLEQARRQFIASEAIAGLGAIAGKLAHNLKNQVGGIRAIAKFQLHVDDPVTREKIDRIVVAADQALLEVKSFMQPLTGWQPTAVDLNIILRDLAETVRTTLQTRGELPGFNTSIDLECLPGDYPLLVNAGRDQVNYIFRNLVDNAIRAIDEKGDAHGVITLRSAHVQSGDTAWADVMVADTGTGIRPEHLDRVFDPQFTTRPEGTIGGYGLFWVRLNVERLGGRIAVSSEPPKGATFRVRLPLMDAAEDSGI